MPSRAMAHVQLSCNMLSNSPSTVAASSREENAEYEGLAMLHVKTARQSMKNGRSSNLIWRQQTSNTYPAWRRAGIFGK